MGNLKTKSIKQDENGYKQYDIQISLLELNKLKEWFKHFILYQLKQEGQHEKDFLSEAANRKISENPQLKICVTTQMAGFIISQVYNKIAKIKDTIFVNIKNSPKITLNEIEVEVVHLFLSPISRHKNLADECKVFFSQIDAIAKWTFYNLNLEKLKSEALLPLKQNILLQEKN